MIIDGLQQIICHIRESSLNYKFTTLDRVNITDESIYLAEEALLN